MKNLIVVAVILQLVITIIEINGEYQFGDIIAFPRNCIIKDAIPQYKHYAIYVGPSSVRDVGQGDNDIVHRTGSQDKRNCRFDKLENTKEKWQEKKDNYLDGVEGFAAGTPEEITARIAEAMRDCERYNLFKNNCEHFSTFIRYGQGKSMQRGTISQCSVVIKPKAKAIMAAITKDREVENDCELNGKPST